MGEHPRSKSLLARKLKVPKQRRCGRSETASGRRASTRDSAIVIAESALRRAGGAEPLLRLAAVEPADRGSSSLTSDVNGARSGK